MPKYTEEQIQKAKDIDVRTFLEQFEGYTFKKSGRYLKCDNPERTGQPSSLTIDTYMNRIFYNSMTGNRPLSAVDWCTKIHGMDFKEAMQYVLGESPNGERVEKPKFEQHRVTANETEKKDFQIPEKADDSKRVFAYLTKSRGIPQHIVSDCINSGIVFQDQRNNAVFAGFDDDGNMKYAARRGTLTIEGVEPFKRDVAGSDKNFAFKMVGSSTDTIYVTEAAIDVMSLAALEDKFNGIGAYKNKTYISTGGAGMDKAIEQFCKTHDVKTINVCFDNDEAGKNGMEKIMDKFRSLGYEVNDMRASLAHDYNDELIASNSNPDFYPEPPVTTKRIQNTTYERNGAEMESNSSQDRNKSEEIVYSTASSQENVTPNEPVHKNAADISENKNTQAELAEMSGFGLPTVDESTLTAEDQSEKIPNEHIHESVQEKTAEVHSEPITSPVAESQTKYTPERNNVIMPNSMSTEQKNINEQHQTEPQQLQPQESYSEQNRSQQSQSQRQQSSVRPVTIVGNIPYQSIQDKVHIKIDDSEIAMKLFQRLQEDKMPYSGRIDNEGLVIAVTNADREKVNDIIRQEQEILRQKNEPEIPKSQETEKIQSDEKVPEPTVNKKEKQELTTEEIRDKPPCERSNRLLSVMYEHQTSKRADLLDKLDNIDKKIQIRTNRVDKLENKALDIESRIKSINAFRLAVVNDPMLSKIAERALKKQQEKLHDIRTEKIPKHKDKIAHQKDKRAKTENRLEKTERKIDRIEKLQNFLTSITSNDRDVRHQGFVTGMENLSEIRAEKLVSSMKKTVSKLENLTQEYNKPDKSHRERRDILEKRNKLSEKYNGMQEKFEKIKTLRAELGEMKNGGYSEQQIDSVLEKTIANLNERIESVDIEERGLVNALTEHSVESGIQAVDDVSKERISERTDRVNPEIDNEQMPDIVEVKVDRERVPDERMPDITEVNEQQILNVIAATTGIDISELNRLPDDFRSDVIAEFQKNNGNVSSEILTETICDIAGIKPPETVENTMDVKSPEKEPEKDNPLRQLEDALEENDNHFDGMLNNMPTGKENRQPEKDKPLFSLEDIMSDKYAPTSSKSQEDIQRDKQKNKGITI